MQANVYTLAAFATLALSLPAAEVDLAQPTTPSLVRVRVWRSPLGLVVRSDQIVVAGVPVAGRYRNEIYDRDGKLAFRTGTVDAVLAELRARGPAPMTPLRHPGVSTPGAPERRAEVGAPSQQRPGSDLANPARIPPLLGE